MSEAPEKKYDFVVNLISGGCAGVAVDVCLYPLDTLKTRFQAPEGFFKAGGFNGIYRGLSAAAVGSAPGAALFFSTYETAKGQLKRLSGRADGPEIHLTAASLGECAACLVRVPTEVVKQNMQTGRMASMTSGAAHIMKTSGIGGFYVGWWATLMREIPFAMIQFPIYEESKRQLEIMRGSPPSPVMAALVGSFSGAIAAAATTPLDVIKTRLMLGGDKHGVPYTGIGDVARRVVQHEGPLAMFSGISPRVFWISIGGFFFFGAYEGAKSVVDPMFNGKP